MATNTNTNVKPDSKRDEYRKYLEKTGVMDNLARVLITLYEEPERPSNAIDYFTQKVIANIPPKGDMDTLQVPQEMNDLRKKAGTLEEENNSLRRKLEQLERSMGGSFGGGAGAGAQGLGGGQEQLPSISEALGEE